MLALSIVCVALLLLINAYPAISNPDETELRAKDSSDGPIMRYQEGDVLDVIHAMTTSGEDGNADLGRDGVMCSYAGDGSVIDWRQLDPIQITALLGVLQAHQDDTLWESADSYGDGRLVTVINQLLLPREDSPSHSTKAVRDIDMQPRTGDSDAIPCNLIVCEAGTQTCWFTQLGNCVMCITKGNLYGVCL